AVATGGRVGSGGAPGTGGAVATGGRVGSGGAPGTGGAVATGGRVGSGGVPGTGGAVATGGRVGSGGAPGTGGTTAGDAGAGPDVGNDGPAAKLDGLGSIYIVHVLVNGADKTVTLSRPIQTPISQEDAELVRKESGCGCPGDLVLKENKWTASCCEQYPDCSIRIDRDTGEVICELYG
ncbi:MAG: hypothetical protein JXP73_00690, partial [Deltaproteobacteria bacterium]|nr:hypothetical protein [Deltaproteobacteria bacterium]